MKKDVAKELPDLIEQEVLLDLSPQQKPNTRKFTKTEKTMIQCSKYLMILPVCNFSSKIKLLQS